MTLRLFFLVPLLLFCYSISAQNKASANFKEGFIVYEIKPLAESEFSGIFNEATLTWYVKDSKSKLVLTLMGAFAEIQFIADKNEDFVALLDIPLLSEKVSIPLDSEEELFSHFIVNKSPAKVRQTEYYFKDKRKIIGRKAYKAIVPIKGSRQKMACYLAQKYTIDTPEFLEKFIGELNGLPLQAEMTILGQKLLVSAKELRKTKISDSVFEVSEDYKQKTLKELKNEIEEISGKKKEKGA